MDEIEKLNAFLDEIDKEKKSTDDGKSFEELLSDFYKTGLPFDLALPYTENKVNAAIRIVQKLSLKLLPFNRVNAHYLYKKCIEHFELSGLDSVSIAKRDLFEKVMLQSHTGDITTYINIEKNLTNQLIHDFLEDFSRVDSSVDSSKDFAKLINQLALPYNPHKISKDAELSERFNAVNTNVEVEKPSAFHCLGIQKSVDILCEYIKNDIKLKKQFLKFSKVSQEYFSSEGLTLFQHIQTKLNANGIVSYLQDIQLNQIAFGQVFEGFKDQKNFIENMGENAKKLHKNKSLREKLTPPFSINTFEKMLKIIEQLRDDIKNNSEMLDMIDNKTQFYSTEKKADIIFNILNSYVFKVISLYTLGYPHGSSIMSLFEYVNVHYDQEIDPKVIFQNYSVDLTRQLAGRFFETALPKEMLQKEKSAGFLYLAIAALGESKNFELVEKNILEIISKKDNETLQRLWEASSEMYENKLHREFVTKESKGFFKKLHHQLERDILLLSPRSSRSAASPRILASQSNSSSSSSMYSHSRSPITTPRHVGIQLSKSDINLPEIPLNGIGEDTESENTHEMASRSIQSPYLPGKKRK